MRALALRFDFRVALLYLFFGGIWILFSDQLLAATVQDISLLTIIQTYKGWIFVAVSTVLIFALLRREFSLRRISESRFEALFENMLDGMALHKVITDDKDLPVDLEYVAGNAMFEVHARVNRNDVMGRRVTEVFPGIEASEPNLIKIYGDVALRGESAKLEFFFEPLNKWFAISAYCPEPLYVATISEDMTERKQMAEELRLSRDRLRALSRQLVNTHETQERAIGRELHDQFGQMLTALKLILEMAQELPPELSAKKLGQAKELVIDLMDRVSNLSLELRPPMLDDLGLIPALLWRVNRYQERTEITVDFKHSGMEVLRFGAEIETTVFRIIQEALTNIARHAKATRVWLAVHAQNEQIEIQIQDNGQGFNPQEAFERNRGLSGMRERARLLNGDLQVDSQEGKGALITLQLPVWEAEK